MAMHKYNVGALLFATLTLSACSKTETIVSSVQTTPAGLKRSVAPDATYVRSIKASIKVKKSAILGQDFFYGADLQYSSIYDKTYDLYTQSSAMGHIPCFFRVNGKELQLIADNRRLFPSDVNHPERLISRFKIISETSSELEISEANSSEFLVTTVDSTAQSPRDHWARSFEYVKEGDYLLQESSVVMNDGTTVEIMESIFPRQTLTPSAEFEKFKMDPSSDVGASEGPAARYRFLPGESIFNGEEKLAYAQHFDIGGGKTIDWYVTRNIQDDQMEIVRQAIEGWNRYFKSFQGISREVVKFKGRLPENVKLGDPRYNVVNWDSRRVAGAAYESQANDPFTGKQSHSVIYMPVAWFQIGMNYWKEGQFTDQDVAPRTKKSKDQYSHICMRDIRGAAEALHSARMSEKDEKDFSTQLMKQTLFHEVGHALGLAHNFKGSLSFDRNDKNSMFSTSIMDYNDYEIERAAFASPTTEDGPLLEYDRQALSAIYNHMRDVAKDAPVVPVCNDAEADTEASGAVDPLCIRYDIEKDPTLSAVRSVSRVTQAAIDGDVTLAASLKNVKTAILTDDALKGVTDAEKYNSLVADLKGALYGVTRFYTVSGKESISRTVRNNIKSLYVFEEDILPEGYVEKDMRDRAFSGVQSALQMKVLPDAVVSELKLIADDSATLLAKTSYAQSLNATDAAAASTKFKDTVNGIAKEFAEDESRGLAKLHIMVLDALNRVETLPLYFNKSANSETNFEKSIVSMFFDIIVDSNRERGERMSAAKALVSYQGRFTANDLDQKAKTAIKSEIDAAMTTEAREEAMDLLNALSLSTDKGQN